jgi:hypothetical protein
VPPLAADIRPGWDALGDGGLSWTTSRVHTGVSGSPGTSGGGGLMVHVHGRRAQQLAVATGGLDPGGLIAVPIDVGKRQAAALVCDLAGELLARPFRFAMNRAGVAELIGAGGGGGRQSAGRAGAGRDRGGRARSPAAVGRRGVACRLAGGAGQSGPRSRRSATSRGGVGQDGRRIGAEAGTDTAGGYGRPPCHAEASLVPGLPATPGARTRSADPATPHRSHTSA